MKILVIDNYDSFTYNLVHSLKKFADDITIVRNDGISLEDVNNYDKILLSPGPGVPDEANLLKPIIEKYAATKSIFGVCLGQQAIGEVFGGKLLNTQEVFFFFFYDIKVIKDDILFKNLPEDLEVGRYHSWVVSNENFPEDLEITAIGPKGEVMALRHKTYDVRGVQFHPESILTPLGDEMIKNWLEA